MIIAIIIFILLAGLCMALCKAAGDDRREDE